MGARARGRKSEFERVVVGIVVPLILVVGGFVIANLFPTPPYTLIGLAMAGAGGALFYTYYTPRGKPRR